jgi:hypothetical protein
MAHANDRKASAAQKSAIDVLQKFYGLIVAAAFMGGVLKFLENFNVWEWSIAQLAHSLLFIAFVSTIILFYHGMERHLFDAHVARSNINWARGGLPPNILLDLFSFMLMGTLLFSMGRQIDVPFTFFQVWSALLTVDIIWSLLVWKSQKGDRPIWALNNIFWLFVAWMVWLAIPVLFERFAWGPAWAPAGQTGAVAIIEILRSIFDYRIHWKFYFPDEEDRPQNLIYLASPYSNDAPLDHTQRASAEKRLARFNVVTEVARQLVEKKVVVYSPLTMTHPIDVRMNHDPGSDFWVVFDETFMQYCTGVYVLKIPGWEASSGVQREIKYFTDRGISPTFLDPQEFGVSVENEEFRAAFE